MAPRFKCGIDSATIEISENGVFAAMSINIGMIAYVFPADVPPWTPRMNRRILSILLIAVVRINAMR
jgi:hypothetical protein